MDQVRSKVKLRALPNINEVEYHTTSKCHPCHCKLHPCHCKTHPHSYSPQWNSLAVEGTPTNFHFDAVNSLTLSRILFNGTDILGVLYATIPFNQLLSKLLSATNRRPFTYVFMLDQNHQPLYHPLLPGNAIIDANIANLEPEGVIRGVLDR